MVLKGLQWEFKNQHLLLLPEKALYWKERQMLVVADLHIGKVGHFRKAGIAIPKNLEQEELSVLSDLIEVLNPKTLVFLGDLFHSEMNDDWNWLKMWAGLFPALEMILVKGNHDILTENVYKQAGFKVEQDLKLDPFLFTHEPLTSSFAAGESYVISGHIHPGIKIRGGARQSLILSCFYFGENQGILPAFGKFTGRYCLPPNAKAKVFGVIKEKVVAL